MKVTKVKDEITIETRTFHTFKYKGKKLNYTCTTNTNGAVIGEGIFDLKWREIYDDALLDKVISSLWPNSYSIQKVLQQN